MSKESATSAPASNAGLNDIQDVMVKLRVSRRGLFNLCAAGKIPYLKLGRRVLFHWPSVEAALLRMQRGGGGAD